MASLSLDAFPGPPFENVSDETGFEMMPSVEQINIRKMNGMQGPLKQANQIVQYRMQASDNRKPEHEVYSGGPDGLSLARIRLVK